MVAAVAVAVVGAVVVRRFVAHERRRLLWLYRLRPAKVKNIEHDGVGSKLGRIHMERQDYDKLQTRKIKALKVLKRQRAEGTAGAGAGAGAGAAVEDGDDGADGDDAVDGAAEAVDVDALATRRKSSRSKPKRVKTA
jgi:hypothetical protein